MIRRLSAVGILLLAVAVLLPTAALAQTTVQYDTGDTSNLVPFPSGNFGNEFTMLGASRTITRVTLYAYNAAPFFNVNFAESRSGGIFTMGQIVGSSGTGFRTLTGVSVMFTGTDVWVGGNNYSTQGIALDTNTGGFGFHAFRLGGTAVTYGGNPANYVLRITGPTGLPVELVNFKIKQK